MPYSVGQSVAMRAKRRARSGAVEIADMRAEDDLSAAGERHGVLLVPAEREHRFGASPDRTSGSGA